MDECTHVCLPVSMVVVWPDVAGQDTGSKLVGEEVDRSGPFEIILTNDDGIGGNQKYRGPVSQQSHLLLIGFGGTFWNRRRRTACAQVLYWSRVVLFPLSGPSCRRHRSAGRDGVSHTHASGP